MKLGLVRDTAATLLSLGTAGIGFVGLGAKKFFIAADDSFTKKFLVGLAATVLTGGVALLPYLVAKPGQETQADLAAARQSSVNNRYGV